MRTNQNIRKNTFKLAASLALLLGVVVVVVPSSHVAAAVLQATDITSGGPGGLPHVQANQNTVKNVLSILFGIIGSFALLNVTLSGFKYITSAGDPQKTSEAKNGIAYSLVGLMLAIAAEAIVAFVVHGVHTS